MIGTRLKLPAVNAAPIDWVRNLLSTVGLAPPTPPGWCARTCSTVSARRHAAVWSVQPELVANVVPVVSAAVSVGWLSWYAPLCTIARWNRPAEPGDWSWLWTLRPPADSPKIVTRVGSPPKKKMLRCTQRSASCWSMRP